MRSYLVLVALIGLVPWGVGPRAADPTVAPQAAPDFRLASLTGGEISLAGLRGRLVLLNFWATWCEPCRREMPGLEALWRRYRDRGLTVLAINEDNDGGARAAHFVARHELTYPVLLDRDGVVGRSYRARALPMSYLVGADGNMLAAVAGARDWDAGAAGALIEQHLPPRR
jgi:peroxiredoxin